MSTSSFWFISLVCQSVHQVASNFYVLYSSLFFEFPWLIVTVGFSSVVNLDWLLAFFISHRFRTSLIETAVIL